MAEYAIIGDCDSRADWGMDLYNAEIGLPKVKTHYLDLPLESGVVDLSEAVTGNPSYGTRELKLYLGRKDKSPLDWTTAIMQIARDIHGKRLPIRLSFDPDFYYVGRISCETEKISFRRSTYLITAICDPYRYYKEVTERVIEVDGTAEMTLDNMDMITSPTFTTDAKDITVSCNGGASLSIFPRTDFNIPEILLDAGINRLNFTGTGTVLVRYQEGMI